MNPSVANAKSKVDGTLIWPEPHKSPWPAWHGHETVPVTDFSGVAAPWNTPTKGTLAVGETKTYTVRLGTASGGPRTRNAALLKAGRSVLRAVPGYVLAPDMTSAKLFVTTAGGVTLSSVKVSVPFILTAAIVSSSGTTGNATARGTKGDSVVEVNVKGVSRGRARLSLIFSDGSTNQVGETLAWRRRAHTHVPWFCYTETLVSARYGAMWCMGQLLREGAWGNSFVKYPHAAHVV